MLPESRGSSPSLYRHCPKIARIGVASQYNIKLFHVGDHPLAWLALRITMGFNELHNRRTFDSFGAEKYARKMAGGSREEQPKYTILKRSFKKLGLDQIHLPDLVFLHCKKLNLTMTHSNLTRMARPILKYGTSPAQAEITSISETAPTAERPSGTRLDLGISPNLQLMETTTPQAMLAALRYAARKVR